MHPHIVACHDVGTDDGIVLTREANAFDTRGGRRTGVGRQSERRELATRFTRLLRLERR